MVVLGIEVLGMVGRLRARASGLCCLRGLGGGRGSLWTLGLAGKDAVGVRAFFVVEAREKDGFYGAGRH